MLRLYFRGDEDVAVELATFFLPALGHLVFDGTQAFCRRLVEEGHRIVAQVDQLYVHVGPAPLRCRGSTFAGFSPKRAARVVPMMIAILGLAIDYLETRS